MIPLAEEACRYALGGNARLRLYGRLGAKLARGLAGIYESQIARLGTALGAPRPLS
jgi:hypothetical protein